MDSIQKIQRNLSQTIHSITDLQLLQHIKSTVDNLVSFSPKIANNLPWMMAKLDLKPLPTFTQVIEQQGYKKLSFKELYPFIDDSEDEYTIDDLLAALN